MVLARVLNKGVIMSIVYSQFSDKYIDTDRKSVFSIAGNDYIESDDAEELLRAYKLGLITEYDMIHELDFDKEELL